MSVPERGYLLNVELSFAQALPPPLARAVLTPWDLDAELYGSGDEIRGARLIGELDADTLRELLRGGLESGLLRAAEVGLRGYIRSAGGQREWMPWRRNVVLSRSAVDGLSLEEGLRYVLE